MSIRARSVVLAVLLLALAAGCGGDDGGAGGSDVDADAVEPGVPGYVALGDSISAGGGAPPYDPASGTCSRSEAGFPILLDDALDDVQLTAFPACGGAVIANLLTEPKHGFPPQIPEEPDPDVELVTLTIGANDLAYGAFIITCFTTDCAMENPEGEAKFEQNLEAIRTTLATEVHPAIRRAYPNARIVHVGYPRFVTARPTALCPALTAAEQEVIEGALVAIHEAFAGAAADVDDPRVEFIDGIDAIEGHELCTADPWMVPLDEEGGGHPDQQGYAALAELLAGELG